MKSRIVRARRAACRALASRCARRRVAGGGRARRRAVEQVRRRDGGRLQRPHSAATRSPRSTSAATRRRSQSLTGDTTRSCCSRTRCFAQRARGRQRRRGIRHRRPAGDPGRRSTSRIAATAPRELHAARLGSARDDRPQHHRRHRHGVRAAQPRPASIVAHPLTPGLHALFDARSTPAATRPSRHAGPRALGAAERAAASPTRPLRYASRDRRLRDPHRHRARYPVASTPRPSSAATSTTSGTTLSTSVPATADAAWARPRGRFRARPHAALALACARARGAFAARRRAARQRRRVAWIRRPRHVGQARRGR